MTKVVNLRLFPYDIYIGRRGWRYGENGYFGNPYIIGKDGDRDTVIEKYREYFYNKIENDTEFKKRILELKDKTLGCFCLDKDGKGNCHELVIKEWLDKQ